MPEVRGVRCHSNCVHTYQNPLRCITRKEPPVRRFSQSQIEFSSLRFIFVSEFDIVSVVWFLSRHILCIFSFFVYFFVRDAEVVSRATNMSMTHLVRRIKGEDEHDDEQHLASAPRAPKPKVRLATVRSWLCNNSLLVCVSIRARRTPRGALVWCVA